MRVFILSNEDLTSNIIYSGLLETPGVEVCGLAFTKTLTSNKGGFAGALAVLKKTDWRYWFFLVFVNGFFRVFDRLSMFTSRWLPRLRSWWFAKQVVSLHAICRARGVPVFHEGNFNDPSFLAKVKQLAPDLILSRVNQILKQEILELPRYGVWGVHSSLLPSYGGIAGEFHGLRNGETKLGTSIFKVCLELDKGAVIFQRQLSSVAGASVFSHIMRNNLMARALLQDAVKDFLERRTESPIPPAEPESYFSWPKPGQVAECAKRGHGLMSMAEAMRLSLFSLGLLPRMFRTPKTTHEPAQPVASDDGIRKAA